MDEKSLLESLKTKSDASGTTIPLGRGEVIVDARTNTLIVTDIVD